MICTGEIYKEDLNTLVELYVSYCSNLTSEKLQEILIQCKNLTILRCSNCTSLTTLDIRENKNLKIINVNFCNIPSIDLRENKNLETLWCVKSHLINIDLNANKKLQNLYCRECRFLINLNISNLSSNYDSKCPWISQNENFSSNLQSLIKLQRWCRRMRMIKYMKSQEFIEWIYNPSNIGGYLHKKALEKFLVHN